VFFQPVRKREFLMPRILVLDDDKLFRDYLTELLKRAGYDVHALSNGSDVDKLIETERFDAIITDLYMPHVDGIEIVRTVKQHSPNTPLIGITGGALGSRDPSTKAMMALGADAMLTKPIDVPAFFAILRRALNPAAPSSNV
jgi:CheY-like chemotaxis protein